MDSKNCIDDLNCQMMDLNNGYFLFIFDEVASTMNVAKKLAKKYSDANLAVISHEQTNGRGRMGRSWETFSGNLYLSIVLNTKEFFNIDMQQVYQISFLFTLTIREVVSMLAEANNLNLNLQCKWPNDVFAEEKKICGVLTDVGVTFDNNQPVVEYLCFGVGLNVRLSPDNLNTTSLNELGLSIDKMDFFHLFISHLKDNLQKFSKDGFFSDANGLKTRWMKNAYKLNQLVEVGTEDKKVSGIFRDIDENGNIVLETNGELIKVNVGDVM